MGQKQTLKDYVAPSKSLGKATGLSRGLSKTQETMADLLTKGVDAIMGAVGLGPESKASAVGELLSMAVPGVGALKATKGTLKDLVKKPIKAFHGSPHDFDQFSLSKIGTGEGAQAYGHGLYFADSEGVARNYRDALSAGSDLPLKADPSIKVPMDYAQSSPQRRAEIKAEFQRMSQAQWADDAARERAAKQVRAFEAFDQSPETSTPGRMYEVNINADPEDFLDWDAPLSQQPKILGKLDTSGESSRYLALQDRLDQLQREGKLDSPEWNAAVAESKAIRESKGFAPTATGEELHRSMWADADAPVNRGRQSAIASERLKAQGIPGIKYLDGASRSAGQGSRNYVVFDDKLISIVRKYGVAGALSAGLINQAQAQQLKQGGYQ